MGNTNQTEYLHLPQWIGTDKPTFLGDFNDAFLKIDNGYNEVSGESSTAIAQAGQALNKAAQAGANAATAKEDATEAKTDANNALTTANNALSQISSISGSVKGVEDKIATNTWIGGAMTPNNNLFSQTFAGSAYYNPFLKLLSIYCFAAGKDNTGWRTANTVIWTMPSNIAPYIKSSRVLYGVGWDRASDSTFDGTNINLTKSGSSLTLTINELHSSSYPYNFFMNCTLCTAAW